MICRCFEELRMDMKMEKHRHWLRCVKGVVGDGENRVIDEKQNDFEIFPFSFPIPMFKTRTQLVDKEIIHHSIILLNVTSCVLMKIRPLHHPAPKAILGMDCCSCDQLHRFWTSFQLNIKFLQQHGQCNGRLHECKLVSHTFSRPSTKG